MDHLTSPKLTPGVHCLNIRHKGMFVTSGPDPDEFTFYDKYDGTAYWCVETQRGFGPDGNPVRPDCCSGERERRRGTGHSERHAARECAGSFRRRGSGLRGDCDGAVQNGRRVLTLG